MKSTQNYGGEFFTVRKVLFFFLFASQCFQEQTIFYIPVTAVGRNFLTAPEALAPLIKLLRPSTRLKIQVIHDTALRELRIRIRNNLPDADPNE